MRNMFGRAAKAPEALMAGPATMDMTRPVLPERAATYVDASSEFTGSLKLSKSVHIDGTVDGELDCAATVTIGASGKVTARISAESVLIDRAHRQARPGEESVSRVWRGPARLAPRHPSFARLRLTARFACGLAQGGLRSARG